MDSIIIFCAKYLFVAVILLAVAVFYQLPPKKRLKFALSIAMAGVVAVVLSKLAGKIYYDPRPFVSSGVKPLVAHAADNGFPSEHTIFAMTLTSVIYFYRRHLAAWSFGVTLLVGIGRILAHVHSPVDIAAAIILGAAAGALGYKLVGRIIRPQKNSPN